MWKYNTISSYRFRFRKETENKIMTSNSRPSLKVLIADDARLAYNIYRIYPILFEGLLCKIQL